MLRYAGLRILSAAREGTAAGPESSIDKLYYSEMDKRHQELVQEILGPVRAARARAAGGVRAEIGSATRRPGQPGRYNFLWSRAGTIYSGSIEIQKNIIGERVLEAAARAARRPAGASREA